MIDHLRDTLIWDVRPHQPGHRTSHSQAQYITQDFERKRLLDIDCVSNPTDTFPEEETIGDFIQLLGDLHELLIAQTRAFGARECLQTVLHVWK